MSAPLCEFLTRQQFFNRLKEINDSKGTFGEAMSSVYDRMVCAVGVRETSFSSEREFRVIPLNCSMLGPVIPCMLTEMEKAFGIQDER